MNQWEFLLQKHGDRAWLPLDSPDVEILTGRYRLVARSNYSNTEVSVRVTHLDAEASPPKRRTRKRNSRTNDKGLLVVMPFTFLKPGLWELSCASSDVMSELVGEAWYYSVHLQVSALVPEPDQWHVEPDVVIPPIATVFAEPTPTEATEAVGIEAVEQDGAIAEVGVGHEANEGSGIDAVGAGSFETQLDKTEPVNPESDLPSPGLPASSEPMPVIQPCIASNADMAEVLNVSLDQVADVTERLSDQLVEELFQEFDWVETADYLVDSHPHRFEFQADERPSVGSDDISLDAEVVEPAIAAGDVTLSDDLMAVVARLSLSLDQDALVAWGDSPLTLTGQVELLSEATGVALPELDGVVLQSLQVELRDPRTSEVLVSDRQPLSSSLPCLFSVALNLPSNLTTHLVLGELTLWGARFHNAVPTLLKTQSFTVTVTNSLVTELTRLKQVMAEGLDAPEKQSVQSRFSDRTVRGQQQLLDLSFLNLTTPTAQEPVVAKITSEGAIATQEPERAMQSEQRQLQPMYRAKRVLPPQIYQPHPSRQQAPRLPAFAHPAVQTTALIDRSATTPNLTDDAAVSTVALAEPPNIALPNVSSLTSDRYPGIPQPENVQTGQADQVPVDQWSVDRSTKTNQFTDHFSNSSASVELPASIELPEDEIVISDRDEIVSDDLVSLADLQPEMDDVPTLESPVDFRTSVDKAFQSLKLQDRFLTRLNSLAADAELSTHLKNHLNPGASSNSSHASDGEASTIAPTAVADFPQEEVVVEDDAALYRSSRRPQRYSHPGSSTEQALHNPLLLSKDEPVPMPVLEVSNDEWISGQPLHIRVKLPSILPRIYVKLWVNDQQTRSMLDGPRWLMDFLPNGFDELETQTQLMVPFGSLGIRIEAIAVEAQTHRESHKVIIERDVVPPHLPDLSLDEFDLAPRKY